MISFATLFSSASYAQQQAPIAPSVKPPAPPSPAPPPQEAPSDAYKIRTQVSLVVLHASVLNDRGVFVPGLMEDNFRVLEDKVEQKLSVFKQEDVPVSFGLVVDNSGSMRAKRPQVNAAALTFVKTSNPSDEGFVVNFNDDYYLDTEHDFTSDLDEMSKALERIDARGSTALYDAVIGSLDHLKKGTRDKKVLIVVTDGEDNASTHSLENAIERAQRSDAVIYAVGVFSDDDIKHDHRAMKKARTALSELTNATGGLAFFPENVDDTESICTQIARDVRNQYTLGYYSTNTAHDGTFRTVAVQVTPPQGKGKLTVRTRTGYYASRAPSSGN
ncbi:MAG TPA: VWA domain-containing protein [Candidatus Acidoferrales bacterium]|nr:VWA domain-containing protein [Candidatus Acidoferrales bacterium]